MEPARDDAEPETYTPDPHRWRILGVTLSIGFMSLLDVTIVNVALPSMRSGLDTSSGTIQWVVSGYALAFGLTLVAGGRLGDAHGRRRLMLIGLTGFIVSSAAVGLAPTAELVVIARLVQGATAGLLTPQNSGLIQQLFRGAERGRAFGFFGLTVSVSAGIGPVLGGAIIALAGEENGWRWLFLVNVPIGLVALVAIARLVPGQSVADAERDSRVDVPGALLLGAGVLCLLYPLVSLEGGARLPLLLLAAAPLFLWAFVRWEARLRRRGHPPLLDVALLRELPGYGNGLAVGALYFTGFTGVFLVLSVFLQEALDLSPLHTGLLLTPFALGSAVTAPIAGRIVSAIGRRVTVIALSVMMSGILLVALAGPGPGRRHDRLVPGPCPADRRPRWRRRREPELHPQPGRGPAAHGWRGRRRTADRSADRVVDRRRAADDGLRPDRVGDVDRTRPPDRPARRAGRARPRTGDGGPGVARPGSLTRCPTMRGVDTTARNRTALCRLELCRLASDRARLVERELLARVLEDRARGVRRSGWVPLDDLGHSPADGLRLLDGGSGEGDRIRDE